MTGVGIAAFLGTIFVSPGWESLAQVLMPSQIGLYANPNTAPHLIQYDGNGQQVVTQLSDPQMPIENTPPSPLGMSTPSASQMATPQLVQPNEANSKLLCGCRCLSTDQRNLMHAGTNNADWTFEISTVAACGGLEGASCEGIIDHEGTVGQLRSCWPVAR